MATWILNLLASLAVIVPVLLAGIAVVHKRAKRFIKAYVGKVIDSIKKDATEKAEELEKKAEQIKIDTNNQHNAIRRNADDIALLKDIHLKEMQALKAENERLTKIIADMQREMEVLTRHIRFLESKLNGYPQESSSNRVEDET